MSGSRLMAGVMQGAPGLIFSWLKGQEAKDTLSPWTQAIQGVPNTSQTFNTTKFSPTGPLNPAVQSAMTSAGLAQTKGGQTSASIPGNVPPDIAAAMFQSASARYGAEKKTETESTAAANKFGKSVTSGVKELGKGIGNIQSAQQEGLTDLGALNQQGMGALGSAADVATQNRMELLTRVDSSISSMMAEIVGGVEKVESLKGEALAAYSDRTAALLESVTDGFQARSDAQKAEVDAMANIPEPAREAMKQRLDYINGSQLRMTTNDVFTSESHRMTEMRLGYDRMITDTLNTYKTLSTQIQTTGLEVAGQAYGQETAAHTALASAAAQLSYGVAESALNYRAKMTLAAEDVRALMVSTQLAGDQASFNMVSSIPRAYVDLATTMGDIYSIAMAINQGDVQKATTDFNATAAQYGMQMNVQMPFDMSVVQGFQQAYTRYDSPEKADAMELAATEGGFNIASAFAGNMKP